MAKENGLGWTTCSVDDAGGTPRAFINDITNLTFATPRGVQDVTGINKSAFERLLLLADFSCTLNGVFDDAATTSAHAVFSTISSTSAVRTLSIVVSGDTLNNEVLATDYTLTRAQDGAFTWVVPFVLADGTVPTWS